MPNPATLPPHCTLYHGNPVGPAEGTTESSELAAWEVEYDTPLGRGSGGARFAHHGQRYTDTARARTEDRLSRPPVAVATLWEVLHIGIFHYYGARERWEYRFRTQRTTDADLRHALAREMDGANLHCGHHGVTWRCEVSRGAPRIHASTLRDTTLQFPDLAGAALLNAARQVLGWPILEITPMRIPDVPPSPLDDATTPDGLVGAPRWQWMHGFLHASWGAADPSKRNLHLADPTSYIAGFRAGSEARSQTQQTPPATKPDVRVRSRPRTTEPAGHQLAFI